MKCQVGVIGLGTMGSALARNLASRGFLTAGYNRNTEVTLRLQKEDIHNFFGYETLVEFVKQLEKPKKIILMVPAGSVVDHFLQQLIALLEPEDIIMDGGNSYFKDTMKRTEEMEEKGIHYFGIGISGGEQGALLGPSIMPGGNRIAYDQIKPFLESIAAKKDGIPCCSYIGPNGSGHYVKMVHNGIEYADMQLITEIYLVLKNTLGKSNDQIGEIFDQWNQTQVKSYLIEITSKIMKEKDPITKQSLVDQIVDSSSQKGTGKWTVLEAVAEGKNISLIQGAVQARITSSQKEERRVLHEALLENKETCDREITLEEVKSAYYLGKIIAYAQGFALMYHASETYKWELNLEQIASIFRAGCIIQAEFLERIMEVYQGEEKSNDMLLHPMIIDEIKLRISDLRKLNLAAVKGGIPVPVLSSALTYLDQLKSDCVGANLIQAQRDFFGAHTFEKIGVEGKVHHEWEH